MLSPRLSLQPPGWSCLGRAPQPAVCLALASALIVTVGPVLGCSTSRPDRGLSGSLSLKWPEPFSPERGERCFKTRRQPSEQRQNHFPSEVPESQAGQESRGAGRPGPHASLLPAVLQAVQQINRAIWRGAAADTVRELMSPAAQLPPVHPCASAMYQQELAVLQQQHGVSADTGPAGASCAAGAVRGAVADRSGGHPGRTEHHSS